MNVDNLLIVELAAPGPERESGVSARRQPTDQHRYYDYAHAEGRGYRDAAEWRTAHEEFFRSDHVAQFLGHVPEIDDDTVVVTQRFRLVGRPIAAVNDGP